MSRDTKSTLMDTMSQVDDIKEKLTDSEYKNLVESLAKVYRDIPHSAPVTRPAPQSAPVTRPAPVNLPVRNTPFVIGDSWAQYRVVQYPSQVNTPVPPVEPRQVVSSDPVLHCIIHTVPRDIRIMVNSCESFEEMLRTVRCHGCNIVSITIQDSTSRCIETIRKVDYDATALEIKLYQVFVYDTL